MTTFKIWTFYFKIRITTFSDREENMQNECDKRSMLSLCPKYGNM